MLMLSDIEQVAAEISALHALRCPDDSNEALLREFECHMLELVRGARSMSKPIVF
jgi:hypothetical protein